MSHPEDGAAGGASALNILLVPYPYSLAATDFRGEVVSPPDAGRRWGWFSVSPAPSGERVPGEDRPAGIVDFVPELVAAAARDVGQVHGIVFPELSLSWVTYSTLVEALSVRYPSLVFVVAGLRTNEVGEAGNFAATTLLPEDPASRAAKQLVEDVRQKHHRWRLDAAQIATYGLGASLDPSTNWWEKLNVLSRSLSIGVLRGETTITALICEDLARVDPAQELLRAIGPNIVIALLMDGPQLQTRWPNRYATVLAEDPGSSVLTFTSLGLIERVNGTGHYPENRCVALWRDDQGVRELHLHRRAQALCLTLVSAEIEEATLDGRSDSRNALAWRFGGIAPVCSEREPPPWRP